MWDPGGDLLNFFGIIGGIIIGVIVIFLICRELVCWYWKINRIVILLEQQNNLLSRMLSVDESTHSLVSETTKAEEIDTRYPKKYVVISPSYLREGPGNNTESISKLNAGDNVIFIKSEEGIDDGITWYNVKTNNEKIGWCIGDCLLKEV